MLVLFMAVTLAADDAAAVWALLDGSLSGVKDVTLTCEGEVTQHHPDGRPEPHDYQTIGWFTPGLARHDRFYPGKGVVNKRSFRHDGDYRQIESFSSNNRALQTLLVKDWGQLVEANTPWTVWRSPFFRIVPPHARRASAVLGTEEIDGVRCIKFKVPDVSVWHPDPASYDCHTIFWIDPERPTLCLKIDVIFKGNLYERIWKIEADEFKGADGRKLWLPTRATLDRFDWEEIGRNGVRKVVYKKDRTMYSSWYILKDTVKINANVDPDKIELQFDQKKRIYSEEKGLPSPGVKPPPERLPVASKATKEEIDRAVADAGRPRPSLEAPPEGSSVLPLILFSVGGILVGVALTLWFKSH